MRHRKIRGRLGRTSAHRQAMINNMITSLFAHERIRTTVVKAKVARRVAERMITLAKRGTLHTRRLAHRRVRDKEVVQKLFAVLGPRYRDRPGGYTRVIRLARRPGDGAELAILELVDRFGAKAPDTERKPTRKTRKKAAAKGAPAKGAPAKGAAAEEAAAAEPEAEGDAASPEAEGASSEAEAASSEAEGASADEGAGGKPADKATPKRSRRGRREGRRGKKTDRW